MKSSNIVFRIRPLTAVSWMMQENLEVVLHISVSVVLSLLRKRSLFEWLFAKKYNWFDVVTWQFGLRAQNIIMATYTHCKISGVKMR